MTRLMLEQIAGGELLVFGVGASADFISFGAKKPCVARCR